MVQLSRETIADSLQFSGSDFMEDVSELELLFTTFEELGGLEETPRLERLCLIDNGLRKVSNMEVISRTLRSLTICDQPLTSIEANSFCLPVLQELHIHRNHLTNVSGLSSCPQVRKLWIFQNELDSLDGIQALSELEELWAQSNLIKSLKGIQYSRKIIILGLAGNPITDFSEIRQLKDLKKLRSLSMNDVHFGRCPLTFEESYKEFVISSLTQLSLLDDVQITQETIQTADTALRRELDKFQATLKIKNDHFTQSVNFIDTEFNGRERYSSSLEREMAAAIQHLEYLVVQNRENVVGQVQLHKSLAAENMTSLQQKLRSLSQTMHDEYSQDGSLVAEKLRVSLLHSALLHAVSAMEARLLKILCDAEITTEHLHFQPVSCNSPDFRAFYDRLSSLKQLHDNWIFVTPIEMMSAFRCVCGVEIVRGVERVPQSNITRHEIGSDIKVAFSETDVTDGSHNNVRNKKIYGLNGATYEVKEENEQLSIYTVLKLEEIEDVLKFGWIKDKFCARDNFIFSTCPSLVADIHTRKYSEQITRSNSALSGSASEFPGCATAHSLRSHESCPPLSFLMVECTIKRSLLWGIFKNCERYSSKYGEYPFGTNGFREFFVQFAGSNLLTALDTKSPFSGCMVFSLTDRDCHSSISIEHVCVCISPHPSISTVGTRGTMGRLEPLLHSLQGSRNEISSKYTHDAGKFGHYHRQADQIFEAHVDRLLEEVSEHEASHYYAAEKNVRTRQNHVGHVEIDIERERREHELLLRALRQAAPQSLLSS